MPEETSHDYNTPKAYEARSIICSGVAKSPECMQSVGTFVLLLYTSRRPVQFERTPQKSDCAPLLDNRSGRLDHHRVPPKNRTVPLGERRVALDNSVCLSIIEVRDWNTQLQRRAASPRPFK